MFPLNISYSRSDFRINIVLLFFSIKLAYLLVNIFAPSDFTRMVLGEPLDKYILQIFSNHDSGWYERLAGQGYPFPIQSGSADNACYAFFPVYPMTGRILVLTTGLSARFSLLLLSTLVSFILPTILYRLAIKLGATNQAAGYGALVLMVFPHHYYFSMIYTEGVYVLLGMLSFLFLAEKKYAAFSVVSSLLVLTRVPGFTWIMPLILFHIQFNRQNIRSFKAYLPFIPMITSLGLYLLFFWINTGDAFFFKQVSEIYWQGKPGNPFNSLWLSLVNPKAGESFLQYEALYVILFLLLSFVFLKRRQYAFWLLCVSGILLPLYEGSAVSQPRFISVLFPFSILLGEYLSNVTGKVFRVSLVMGMIVLHLTSFVFWNMTHPLSY